MTASLVEVEAAIGEGVEILDLMAQKKIIKNEKNKAIALTVQPNMVSNIGKDGRPNAIPSDQKEVNIPGDLIIFAIGQGIDSAHFEEAGLAIERKNFKTDRSARVLNSDGVFAGGDCVTGPSLAIEAIAAGKVAAANIDSYLGYRHEISCDVKIPDTEFTDVIACGRINVRERPAHDAKDDFRQVEIPMTERETDQEVSRCLRCDCFGFGILKNGRESKW